MRAGPMRHRIALQRRLSPPQPDGYGQQDGTWTTVATVWASVVPLAGVEQVYAGGVASDNTHKVTMRFYDGIDPSWRILYGSRVLNIDSTSNPDEVGREHLLMCKEAD